MVHGKTKIIANLPFCLNYLCAEFANELEATCLCPPNLADRIEAILDWIQHNLRPCIRQLTAYSAARHRAGELTLSVDCQSVDD